MVPPIPPARYPTTDYRTVPLVWDVAKFDELAVDLKARIAAERLEMAESVAHDGSRHVASIGSAS